MISKELRKRIVKHTCGRLHFTGRKLGHVYNTREEKNRAFLLNMVLEMNSETWRIAAGFFLAEEYIPGKRIRRWPRLSWVNDLVRDVACSSYLEMKMMADNRYEWKIPIHGLLHVTDCLDRKFHINKTNFLFVYQF